MERIRTLEVDIELLREHNVPGLTDRLEEIRLKVFERRAVLKDIIGTIRDPEVALARRSRGGEPDPDDGSSPS